MMQLGKVVAFPVDLSSPWQPGAGAWLCLPLWAVAGLLVRAGGESPGRLSWSRSWGGVCCRPVSLPQRARVPADPRRLSRSWCKERAQHGEALAGSSSAGLCREAP